MKINIKSNLDLKNTTIITSGFLDTGGFSDYAAWTQMRTDVYERIIYITGVMFWKINEKEGITLAKIRNDIAKLCKINKYNFIGCETNNYGRSEMESLRREYNLPMFGVNTVGRITSKKIEEKGESMDKEAIIRFFNSWRQNAVSDPENQYKLGQIKTPKVMGKAMQKLMNEFENFIRKDPEGIVSSNRPKFGAEGSGHDDGVMSCLGHVHLIKTKVFKLYGQKTEIAAVYRDGSHKQFQGNDRVQSIQHSTSSQY